MRTDEEDSTVRPAAGDGGNFLPRVALAVATAITDPAKRQPTRDRYSARNHACRPLLSAARRNRWQGCRARYRSLF